MLLGVVVATNPTLALSAADRQPALDPRYPRPQTWALRDQVPHPQRPLVVAGAGDGAGPPRRAGRSQAPLAVGPVCVTAAAATSCPKIRPRLAAQVAPHRCLLYTSD